MSSAIRVTLAPVSEGTDTQERGLRFNDPNLASSVDGLREFVIKGSNRFHNAVVVTTIIQEVIALYNADQDVATEIASDVAELFLATNSLTFVSITPNSHSHLSTVPVTVVGTGFSLFTGIVIKIGGASINAVVVDDTHATGVAAIHAAATVDVTLAYLFDPVNTLVTAAGAFTYT